MTTLNAAAAEAALLSAARVLRARAGGSDPVGRPAIPFNDRPDPAQAGYDVAGAIGCLVGVATRRDARARTVYLYLSPLTAPPLAAADLAVEIGAGAASIRVAASSAAGAPWASSLALLQALAVALEAADEAAHPANRIADYAAVDLGALGAALRITARRASSAQTRQRRAHEAATFTLRGTVGPWFIRGVGADDNFATTVAILAEPAGPIDVAIWGRVGPIGLLGAAAGLAAPLQGAWTLIRAITGIAPGGYLDRVDVAGLASLFVQVDGAADWSNLHADDTTERVDLAHVTVAPAVAEVVT